MMLRPTRLIRLVIYLSTLVFFINPSSQVDACWGTRPDSMGGAFTGVADDINAVYWNPAGLAYWQRTGFTSMVVSDPDDINYDLYVAGALPLRGDLFLGQPATLALAYTYNKDLDYIHSVRTTAGGRYELRVKDPYNEFFHLSGGMLIHKAYSGFSDIAIGVTVKVLTKQLTVEEWFYDNNLGQWDRLKRKTYSDYEYDADLGILLRWGKELGEPELPSGKGGESIKMFSVGGMIQNVKRSKLLGKKMIRNYRPGFGFRPHANVLLSFELYDAGKEYFHQPQRCYGGELWLNHPYTHQKFIAFRYGIYHANEKKGEPPNMNAKAYTCGFGLKWPIGYLRKGKAEQFLDIDYGMMKWVHAKELTRLFSLGVRF